MHQFHYSRQDWSCALFITLFILFIGSATLTTGVPDWGDDFAAYMSEGMAIADGNFHEQTVKNYTMHPSPLVKEAKEDGLVYVWGYPLLLSAVYKVVGFDRDNFTSIIWYKVPLLMSVGLLGGGLFLFYRRRFSLGASVILAVLMCLSGDLFEAMNNLYSDLPFLFFSIFTLLLSECAADKLGENQFPVVLVILYGIVLWFTHELRLNGITVCGVALMGHLLFLIRNRKAIEKRKLWQHAVPYIVFAVLTLMSEHFWLAPATSNMSDVGRATAKQIAENMNAYWSMIYEYLDGIEGIKLYFLGYLLTAAIVVGILYKGITENLHLTLLVVGTLVVDIMLPYQQGLRYLYNILPLLLMYAAYGLQFLWKAVRKMIRIPEKKLSLLAGVMAVIILCFPIAKHMKTGVFNLNHWGWKYNQDVYIGQAVDIYNYIQNNVPESETIAFGKPRALYLNTGRLSFRPGYNSHKIADADYYLEYLLPHSEFTPEKKEAAVTPMSLIYENEFFKLFEVNHTNNEETDGEKN